MIEPERHVFDFPDGVRLVLARGIDAATITAALLEGLREVDSE